MPKTKSSKNQSGSKTKSQQRQSSVTKNKLL